MDKCREAFEKQFQNPIERDSELNWKIWQSAWKELRLEALEDAAQACPYKQDAEIIRELKNEGSALKLFFVETESKTT